MLTKRFDFIPITLQGVLQISYEFNALNSCIDHLTDLRHHSLILTST